MGKHDSSSAAAAFCSGHEGARCAFASLRNAFVADFDWHSGRSRAIGGGPAWQDWTLSECGEILDDVSDESVEVVRVPVTVRSTSRRALEERFGLRFPRARTAMARLVLWLPRRSRLRQAVLRRVVRLGCEALNRRDFEAGFMVYHPAVELIAPEEIVQVGFEPVLQGRPERIRYQMRWVEEWGEFLFEPEQLITLDDTRLLVVGRMVGSGRTSGAAFEREWAVLFTISAGQVTREQFFFDHSEGLRTAGLAG